MEHATGVRGLVVRGLCLVLAIIITSIAYRDGVAINPPADRQLTSATVRTCDSRADEISSFQPLLLGSHDEIMHVKIVWFTIRVSTQQ